MKPGARSPTEPVGFPRYDAAWLRIASRVVAAILAVGIFFVACTPDSGAQSDTKPGGINARGKAATPVDPAAGAPASANQSAVTAEDMIGKSGPELLALLGKPQGTIHTKRGALWLYPQWRVQFDAEEKVLGVEKDFPLPLATLDPKLFGPGSQTGSARSGATTPASAGSKITVVSNGGQEVDLGRLLSIGKITVVDFYADWCGPCRQISPYLERLSHQDPDIALVKVDIVDWQTPVTRQFSIRSIPSIRVFDRRGGQVGDATHNLQLVVDYINRAKR